MMRSHSRLGAEGAVVDFGLLGSVEAWHDGQPLALRGTHRRCMLAVLLLEAGRVVTVDRLVELVWGDDPPMAVRNTVATHVSRLRRTLDRDEQARASRGLSESHGGTRRVSLSRPVTDAQQRVN